MIHQDVHLVRSYEGIVSGVRYANQYAMGSKKHLVGQRFGRLTVLFESGRDKHGSVLWTLRCDCGTTIQAITGSLTGLNTTSCGCNRTKHGQAGNGRKRASPLYEIWSTMIARCERPTAKGYEYYGGAGIRVCERWRESFQNFMQDMGPRPSKAHTIDRKRSTGDYGPDNCRRATPREQARNKRNNVMIEVNGETKTIAEWAEISGLKYTTIRERLRRGWPSYRAVTAPTRSSFTQGRASS